MTYKTFQPHLMLVIPSLEGEGAARMAADIADHWVQRGYRVSVVTGSEPAADASSLHPRVVRHSLRGAPSGRGGFQERVGMFWCVLRLRRIMQRERPTVVLGITAAGAVMALQAARGLPCRVIAVEHTHPEREPLSPLWQRLRRRAYPRAWCVVAPTRAVREWLDAHVPGCRLAVVPHAVCLPVRTDAEPVVTPPELHGRYRLLAAGSLEPGAGFDVLLQAFARLANYYPLWDLAILGEGTERQTLIDRSGQLGLAARVMFPGDVGNMADWYASSDLYVLSSHQDAPFDALTAAMASGLPVVACDAGTWPGEIVRPGIDGSLVSPVEDPDALAAYLSDLMGRPDKRENFALRATDVRERFSVARVMRLWQSLFEQPFQDR